MGSQRTKELFEEITSALSTGGETVLEGDEMIDFVEGLLRERAEPGFETVMVALEGPPLSYTGVEGFREAMTDWLSPWATFRFEIEEIVPLEDMILMLVRQVGTTKHGGVEIETESGTIWNANDGRLSRATFYLDQQSALKAAGIDPGRHSGD